SILSTSQFPLVELSDKSKAIIIGNVAYYVNQNERLIESSKLNNEINETKSISDSPLVTVGSDELRDSDKIIKTGFDDKALYFKVKKDRVPVYDNRSGKLIIV